MYQVSQPSRLLHVIDTGDEGVFAGAIVTPDAGLRVLTEQSKTDLTFHDLPYPSFTDVPKGFTLTDNLTVGNVIAVTATGVHAVGNTGPNGMRVAAQFDVHGDGLTPGTIPWASMQPTTLLKTELTVGNGTRTGTLDTPVAGGSGFTDLAYASVIDLSKYLVDTGSPDWAFHSMLLAGPYLYVTAADTDGDGHWVVLRLVRGIP